MKTKGITVVERFIEKGILGLAAVFAVAFAAMQLLSEAPTTKAAGGEVNPGTVDSRLEEQTRRLSRGQYFRKRGQAAILATVACSTVTLDATNCHEVLLTYSSKSAPSTSSVTIASIRALIALPNRAPSGDS